MRVKRYWLRTVAYSALISLIVSLIFTLLDWIDNPSGLFHSHQGTNWPVVGQTVISWIVPVFLVLLVTGTIVLCILERLDSKR